MKSPLLSQGIIFSVRASEIRERALKLPRTRGEARRGEKKTNQQTELAILSAWTRGLGRIGGIVGSFSELCLVVRCKSNHSLGQHSFELLTFSRFHLSIWLYLFVCIWQQLVSVYLFPQNGFGFSYPQLPPPHFLKKKKKKIKKYTFSNKRNL